MPTDLQFRWGLAAAVFFLLLTYSKVSYQNSVRQSADRSHCAHILGYETLFCAHIILCTNYFVHTIFCADIIHAHVFLIPSVVNMYFCTK